MVKKRNLYTTRKRFNLPYDEAAEFSLNSREGKMKYYREKMDINSSKELFEACKSYLTGMKWVYLYYFYGLPSWTWYYPYHFAPFMCDLACVSGFEVEFALNKPLLSMEQLLAVLPPRSRKLLPECLRGIFTEYPEMYPEDFKVDPFYTCLEWQAIPILPFADAATISEFFARQRKYLSFKEADRNVVSYAHLYSRKPDIIQKTESIYSGQRAFENVKTQAFFGRAFPLPDAAPLGTPVDKFCFKYVNQSVVFSFDQRKSRSGDVAGK